MPRKITFIITDQIHGFEESLRNGLFQPRAAVSDRLQPFPFEFEHLDPTSFEDPFDPDQMPLQRVFAKQCEIEPTRTIGELEIQVH